MYYYGKVNIEEVITMINKEDVLRSLAEALDQLNDECRSYLIGYAEGVIAGRQAQVPGGAG